MTGHAPLTPRARQRERLRRRRVTVTVAALVAVSAAVLGATALLPDGDEAGPAEGKAPAPRSASEGPPDEAPTGAPSSESTASSTQRPAPRDSASDAASDAADVPVPATGPGTFTVVRESGPRQGRGPVRRYRVEIEDGIELPGPATARAVSDVLGDARGWTRDDDYGFQLVASGPVDFRVRIATPGTTDRLCGVTRPVSRGNVNCRVHHDVVVNLKRWVQGSPKFDGPVEEYRALIINHEVGHELGHGHETCPGPGRPAPAMMQQIKGLRGCKANAWPYDKDGEYVRGPAVP